MKRPARNRSGAPTLIPTPNPTIAVRGSSAVQATTGVVAAAEVSTDAVGVGLAVSGLDVFGVI